MNFIKDKLQSVFFDIDLYKNFFEKILYSVLVWLLAFITIRLLLKIVDYVVNASLVANDKLGINSNKKRSDTIHKLFRSVVRYSIYFIAIVQILSIFGINTTGILASAGIVSVAIGFGAQSLVRDIITGFFLIIEGQFDVGDYVKISNQAAFIAEGNVLSLGLRSTKIKSTSGEIYFIPNSSINQVINYSQTYHLARVEFPIEIIAQISDLEDEINNLIAELNDKEDYTKHFYKKEKIKFLSINNIENSVALVEVIVKVKLNKKITVESLLRKDFYRIFQNRIKSR